MPFADDHARQAKYDLDLYDHLAAHASLARGWLLTIAFYTLVHCCEHVLASRGIHSRTHAHREHYISQLSGPGDSFPWLEPVLPAMQRLKILSEHARYGTLDNTIVDWFNDARWDEFLDLYTECRDAFCRNCADLDFLANGGPVSTDPGVSPLA
jgi:hypothetical protein